MAATALASRPRGAPDRVRVAHEQARATLRLALAIVGAAVVAAVLPHDTGRWLPLHLFLAGGLGLAISAASLLLTVTWSAATPPPARWVALQRWSVAVGAVGVAASRELAAPDWVLASAGALFGAGLVLLGLLLVRTVRTGVERRFDPAVRAYVAALTAGLGGGALGVAMATGTSDLGLRPAHLTLNLLGLIGLVVAGTLPFFVPTVARSQRTSRATPRWLGAHITWLSGSVLTAALGFALGHPAVAGAALAAYAAGVVATLGLVPPPTRRQLAWAGPRLVGIWAGTAWWATSVGVFAMSALAGAEQPYRDSWLGALIVAGFGQILWGALAYLLPMLRGGGREQLAAGFATTRSRVALVAANAAGVGLVARLDALVVIAIGGWALDSAVRVARLRLETERRDV